MNKKQVKHLADLAKLKLTPSEEEKFQVQLTEVLVYVDQLNSLNLEKIEPTSQVTGLENVYRSDQPEESFPLEKVFSGTKSRKDNFFKIKAILKK